jgi:electron transfer flavoprotein alpha subunit
MECPILVVAEHFDEKLSSVTLPLIMQGRHLADRNASELGIVVLGSGLESLLEELATTGADRVYFVDEPELKHYNPEIYTEVMHQVLTTVLPQIVLLGYTFVGMELGPAIAVRTGLKLLSNCTGVELTNQSLVITCPLYRGAVNVKIEFDPRTRLILSLQESELPRQPATQRKAVLQKMPASVGNSRTEVVGFVRPEPGEVDITEANIIVAVGRGIQEKENIKLAEALANALDGLIACSRPLTDLGWLPPEHQVGMSGKVVKPKVYIACGISGASHHIMGMKNSALIIAINTDANAPIFNIAHYGVQGDLSQILPELVARANDVVT